MAKRLNLWEDDVNKLLMLNEGDEFIIMKQFNFSGDNGYSAEKHLQRNIPLNKEYYVSENISKYYQELDGVVDLGRCQEGYSADYQQYLLNGWRRVSNSYPSSKMTKGFSRFKVKAIGYERIFNDSTSWFSASIKFKLLESVPCRLSSTHGRKV